MAKVYSFHSGGYRFDDDEAVTRQNIVASLKRSIDGVGKADNFHVHFSDAVEHHVWEMDRQLGAGGLVEPMPFDEFVTKPFPEGLGTDHDTMERLLSGTPQFTAYVRLTKRKAGNPTGANQHTKPVDGGIFDNVQNSSNAPKQPTGNSEAAGLRRLTSAADTGDVHAQSALDRIHSGGLSVNAACIELGWRKKTVTVRDEPIALFNAAVAKAGPLETAMRAWRMMSQEDKEQLLEWQSQNQV